MFNNIDSKIKALANVMCWVGITLSFVLGILVASAKPSVPMSIFTQSEPLLSPPLLGLLIMVGGSLLSWIGCFVLYALGEIVENTAILCGKKTLGAPVPQGWQDSVQVQPSVSAMVMPAQKQPSEPQVVKIGKCNICDRENVEVQYVKIVDDMGTRYRNVCSECKEKNLF